MNVEIITSHCNWYFDLIHATACVIDVTHFVLGSITHVLSHLVSIRRIQLVFGSIFKKVFTSFCSVISLTTSMIIYLIFFSSFLIIQLYIRVMVSSNDLSLVRTPFEVIRFHLLSKSEKNIQFLSSVLYLL